MTRIIACLLLPLAATCAESGADLPLVWARAATGQPLRVVAMGGSITQAGGGWIGPWLAQRFPRAPIALHNAGISGTGSWFGMFRCAKDVAAARPDLVLLEFTVNDGHIDTPQVRWAFESLLRSILLLPGRPAVVVLESANRRRPDGVVSAHRVLARHYGLLAIDLHGPVVERSGPGRSRWHDLLDDDVHPNQAGHALYRELIAQALEPGVVRAVAGEVAEPPPLPAPLSERPLLLDGVVTTLPVAAPGWRFADSVPGWWTRFFPGALVAEEEGRVLTIPVRGTALGMLLHVDPSAGILGWSIDGGEPHLQPCNLRSGFTALRLADDLPPGDHVLRLVLPYGGRGGSGVTVGAILQGGAAAGGLAGSSASDDRRLATLVWGAVEAEHWLWAGPYGDLAADWRAEGPTAALGGVFPPETALPGRQAPDRTQWRPFARNALVLDLGAATGQRTRGISYAWTVLRSDAPRRVRALLNLDYYAVVWVGGREVLHVDRHHGSPADDLPLDLDLVAGDNPLVIKLHAGSMGNLLALRLVDASGVQALRP